MIGFKIKPIPLNNWQTPPAGIIKGDYEYVVKGSDRLFRPSKGVKLIGIRNRNLLHGQQLFLSLKSRILLMGAATVVLTLAGCATAPAGTGMPNALDTRGPVASRIASEWWIQFILGTAVFLVVAGLLIYILYRRRVSNIPVREVSIDLNPAEEGRLWIWWGGIIIPIIILTFLLGLSMYGHVTLAAPRDNPDALTVEVIGHRWWWEVRYPEEGIVAANEIHIPVGRPVEVHLTSRDVIHSFWAPQLAGKMDLTPGDTNSIWIQADEPGVFRGLCAEFCGLQHANMQFVVVAEEEGDFGAWLERERQPAPEPQDETTRTGQQVFLGSSCVYCHTVRGTNATGELGPDLTHLASRLTLAAGILDNNRGNLAGWIIDPQHLKPGNLMPPTNLSGPELQALLAYLESLE